MQGLGVARLRTTSFVVALFATLAVGAVPAFAQPTVDEPATVSSDRFRVGTELTGTVGDWSGTGEITYTLSWELCNAPPEAPACITRSSQTTTNPEALLAYTPVPADNTTGVGTEPARLEYYVRATDSEGSTRSLVASRQVRASRLWESPRRSGYRPVNGGAPSVLDSVTAPDGTTTVLGLRQTAEENILEARRIEPDGSVGPVEPVVALGSSAIPDLVGADVDDQGRVLVAFRQGFDGALRVTDRDPGTGAWSAPATVAPAADIAYDYRSGGSVAREDGSAVVADGAGNAVVWWVAPRNGEEEPQEMNFAVRDPGSGGWSAQEIDQPSDDPCEGGARLQGVEDPLVDIAPDGDVVAVWSRFHESCYDTYPPFVGYTEMQSAYLTDGTWSGMVQLARLGGFNGYLPTSIEASAAGSALVFRYEHNDGRDSSTSTTNAYLHTTGPGGQFAPIDTTDPLAASPAQPIRTFAPTDGGPQPSNIDLSLNDAGDLAASWVLYDTDIDYPIEAVSGSIAEGAEPYEVLISSYASNANSTNVEVAADGSSVVAAGLGSRYELFATRDPAAASWSPPELIDLAPSRDGPRWSRVDASELTFIDSGRLVLAGGYVGAFDGGSDRHYGVTRLAAGDGGPSGTVGGAYEAPVGRTIALEAVDVEDPDGLEVSYAWDLDADGAFDDATGQEIQTSFDSPGDKEVAVRLTTPDGDRGFAMGSVNVRENAPPYAQNLYWDPSPPVAGSPTTFYAVASDDFDQGSLSYEWTFDDVPHTGDTDSTAVKTLSAGTHTAAFRATDLDGAVSEWVEVEFNVSDDPPPDRTLMVQQLGTGAGTITSSPGGISCAPECSAQFAHGSSVTLTAAPQSGSRLDGWNGCDELTGAGTQCVVAMNSNRQVSVTFEPTSTPPQPKRLDVSRDGSGSGSVSGMGIICGEICTQNYDPGTEVTLTANPAQGSEVTDWSGCDAVLSLGTQCRVTMSVDREVRATFEPEEVAPPPPDPIDRTLLVDRDGDGSGVVTGTGIDCGSDCSQIFEDGTSVTLTANPVSGSSLTSFSGCDQVSGNQCTVTMDADTQVVATFALDPVAPAAIQTKISGQTIKKRKAKFTFIGNGGTGPLSYECKIDDAAFKACASPKSYKLKPGKHNFQVRAKDATGAVDATPAKAKFKIKKKRKKTR